MAFYMFECSQVHDNVSKMSGAILSHKTVCKLNDFYSMHKKCRRFDLWLNEHDGLILRTALDSFE